MADQALNLLGTWLVRTARSWTEPWGVRRSSAWTAFVGFTIARAGIVEIDVVADSERLRRVHLAVLNDW